MLLAGEGVVIWNPHRLLACDVCNVLFNLKMDYHRVENRTDSYILLLKF
jgi:uncharacterized C2H2 Zn-finger protein